MTRRLFPSGLFTLVLLALVAPAWAHDFDPGYYYATGTIRPAGMSFFMEGTHRLENASGGLIALLSSDSVDLDRHMGAKVRVSGWTDHTVEGHALHMDVWTLTVLESARLPFAFTSLEKGTHTNYQPADAAKRQIVIRDADTWTLFWNAHRPGATAPAVDFKKRQVIGTFETVKPSGGYSVAITKVERAGTSLFVTTKSTSPAPGTIVTMVSTLPYALVTTSKTTGKVHIGGKTARVLSPADFKSSSAALLVLGHVTLTGAIDPAKVKCGVFSMDARARYFAWPGMFPTNVTEVHADGAFLQEFAPADATANPYVGYTVIVWEDTNGDNQTSGETLITTESFRHDVAGATWHNDAGDAFTHLVHVELELAKP